MFAILTAVSSFGFASEPLATTELPLEVKQSLVNVKSVRNWFGYMRMGPSSRPVGDAANVLPALGLGWRYSIASSAIDISASYTGVDAFASNKESYSFTLPRVSYLYYFSPESKAQSFYMGAGLAYGGSKTDAMAFNGLIPSLSAGYEMNRHQNWRSFMQLDVSHPTFATTLDKPFVHMANMNFSAITAEFSVGLGY